MKGCIKGLIGLVVAIVLLVVVVVVLLNVLTPATVGLADIEVYNGQTLRDMGLADVKFIEIYKLFKSIMNPNDEAIVKNGYNAETEKAASYDNLADSSLEKKENGEIIYTSLLSEPAIYSSELLLTYNDTTLGYIFNQMIQQGVAEGSESSEASDGISFLKEINATIREVTLTKTDGGATLRMVLSVDISSFKTQIEEAIPGGLGKMLKIPDTVYIVSYLDLTVGEDGVIVCTSRDLRINDADNAIATAIFKVLASQASSATEGEVSAEDASDTIVINEQIGNAFSTVVSNLGKVGTASVNASGKVTGDKVLGNGGLYNGKLTLITNTAEE